MYFLIEDNLKDQIIIKKFYNLEEARKAKIEHELIDMDNGSYCNYFITKFID